MSDVAETRLDKQTRLAAHFSTHSGKNYLEGWEKLWSEKSYLPWDRGTPSPALEDALAHKTAVIGRATAADGQSQRRKLALIPGCGRGVDVLLLAAYGYDAVGLDYSSSAIEECKRFEQAHKDEYPAKDPHVGKGTVTFVSGNFFERDWETAEGKYDLIYDYTVSEHT